ncbi:hypothetical protein RND81_09G195200 [Saponaria officinalis]|uniref:Cytochrome P450 n=1 Tax=Saponaria officinalis TaxID=3572 RepID=A0AAW1IPR5_SAPOF
MDAGIKLVSLRLISLYDIKLLEIFIAILVFLVIHSLRQKTRQGLPVWPFVGMLPSLIIGRRKNMYEWLTDVLCRQNGTFYFRGPWLADFNSVMTADPRNLEHLLKTKFTNFPKGEYFPSTLRDLLGDGIFNADGETWLRQRKTASIEFHSATFRQLSTQSLVELVEKRLLLVFEESIENSVSIDLQDVLLRLTFDNVCAMAFGVDPGSLRPGLPEIPFAQAFEKATEMTFLRFVTPTVIWKVMRYLNLGSEKVLKESIKGVNEFADEVIRTRKKELALQDENEKLQKSDLLTVFMRLKEDDGKPFSDRFLRDICVNFLLAGRDSTSVALCWFFWLIDQHPQVEQNILEEIFGIIGQRKDAGNDDCKASLVFQADEIKKMEYLHAAISESLRLYPAVPLDHKQVVEEDIFPDGTLLKRGTKVLYSIYSMGRMEAIWGTDCREYKPERWLKDGRFMSESAYKFTAFNGGPRLCLGKDFAYYQMKFVAASILHCYHVKVVKNHPVQPKLSLTLYMKHGLRVNLIRRDESVLRKYPRIKN